MESLELMKGWCLRVMRVGYGVGLWKAIRFGWGMPLEGELVSLWVIVGGYNSRKIDGMVKVLWKSIFFSCCKRLLGSRNLGASWGADAFFLEIAIELTFFFFDR